MSMPSIHICQNHISLTHKVEGLGGGVFYLDIVDVAVWKVLSASLHDEIFQIGKLPVIVFVVFLLLHQPTTESLNSVIAATRKQKGRKKQNLPIMASIKAAACPLLSQSRNFQNKTKHRYRNLRKPNNIFTLINLLCGKRARKMRKERDYDK